MDLRKVTSTTVLILFAIVGALSVAKADCYDVLGCSNISRFSMHFDYLASIPDGPTCDFLWDMRNRIFKEHGYCFNTARGRSEMGNEGCSIKDLAAVPLNSVERENVATIARAERLKSCSR